MKTKFLFLVVGAVIPLASITGSGADVARLPDAAQTKVEFQQDIKPILERSCVHCHGAVRPKSHFRVDSRQALLEGGASEEAGILPGQSEKSPLVRYIADLVEEMEMPPLQKREKYPALTRDQIALVRAWIDQGASWPEGIVIKAPAVSAAEGPEEKSPTQTKARALFASIRQGDTKAILRALDDKSLLQSRDKDGNTPLMHAAFYSDAALLGEILKNGADPNATNNAGATALMKAVSDLKKVRVLLKHGAKVNTASAAGNTALIIAAHEHGSSAVLKELLAHGADVHAASHRGINAVYAAAQSGDAEALRTLLAGGGKVNSTGQLLTYPAPITALMVAASSGYLDCVKLLAENGADIRATSEYGNALSFAAFTQRSEVARFLIDRGVGVNFPGRRIQSFVNDNGFTPLMYAATTEGNDPALVQSLIERGADLNIKASSGETALGIARRRGNTKIVAALKAAGAVCDEEEEKYEFPVASPLWTLEQVKTPTTGVLRQAAERGLAIILASGSRFTEATANRCFTCHQQSQPALALSIAREGVFNYDQGVAREQLNATLRAAAVRKDLALEEPLAAPGIAAWLLVGLDASGHTSDDLTDAYAYALARSQSSDGRWIARAARAPSGYSDVTSTALAIRALKVYARPPRRQEIEGRIARAAEWLRNYQSLTTEERSFQILGLSWAGTEREALLSFAKALLEEQRSNGGWAQLATLDSDAYATGLALYALSEAGRLRAADPTYKAGVEFLLKNQLSDGSWFVRTRASPLQVAIDDIFPHGKHQWISSVATTWSVMALMRGVDRR